MGVSSLIKRGVGGLNDPLDRGVKRDGSKDCTEAIQEMIEDTDIGRTVVFDHGTYQVDGVLELGFEAKIELKAGAKLLRSSGALASTDPLVWLKGANASVKGSGVSSCIKSENTSPLGVVRLGAKDMQSVAANWSYMRLEDVDVIGSVAQGDGTSVGVCGINPQLVEQVSYFNWISGVRSANTNSAFKLMGESNGYQLAGLQAFQAKNALWLDGAIEASLFGMFHHFSPNGVGLKITDHDNTATLAADGYAGDGRLHRVQYCDLQGICLEAGAGSLGIDSTGSTGLGNYIVHRNNSLSANIYETDFLSNNQVISINSARIPVVETASGQVGVLP